MTGHNSTLALLGAFSVIALSSCDQPGYPTSEPPPEATQWESAKVSPEELTERRIRDLIAIHAAIEAYHQANGRYPVSPNAAYTSVALAGEQWIPELVPEFIEALPRDPLRSNNNNRPQYWYSSDGRDFKLIAHGVGGMCGREVEQGGIRWDPARTRDDRCWAYGYWTEGRRGW